MYNADLFTHIAVLCTVLMVSLLAMLHCSNSDLRANVCWLHVGWKSFLNILETVSIINWTFLKYKLVVD